MVGEEMIFVGDPCWKKSKLWWKPWGEIELSQQMISRQITGHHCFFLLGIIINLQVKWLTKAVFSQDLYRPVDISAAPWASYSPSLWTVCSFFLLTSGCSTSWSRLMLSRWGSCYLFSFLWAAWLLIGLWIKSHSRIFFQSIETRWVSDCQSELVVRPVLRYSLFYVSPHLKFASFTGYTLTPNSEKKNLTPRPRGIDTATLEGQWSKWGTKVVV